MMMSNESLRRALNPTGHFSLPTFLCAGAISGALAAAVTTPLDVIKTRLQTQGMTRAHQSKVSVPLRRYTHGDTRAAGCLLASFADLIRPANNRD